MIVRGLDCSALDPQFEPDVPGRVLVLDGDAAVYRATATAKKIDTAYRRFITDVLTDKFLTKAEQVHVHLTSHRCRKADRGLYPTFKPYQGNRANKAKPPLLEPLRELLGTNPADLPEEISVHLQEYFEADDTMRMQALALGDRSVTKSDDKDMRIFSTPYWETAEGRLSVLAPGDTWGYVKAGYTEAGTLKAKGHGHAYFWLQCLMGDTADNVQGLHRLNGKPIGARGALDFIGQIDDENEAANRILWEFVRSKQNALPELEMLWLRRTETDSAAAYVLGLELDTNLRAWVTAQHKYHQALIKAHYEENGDD